MSGRANNEAQKAVIQDKHSSCRCVASHRSLSALSRSIAALCWWRRLAVAKLHRCSQLVWVTFHQQISVFRLPCSILSDHVVVEKP